MSVTNIHSVPKGLFHRITFIKFPELMDHPAKSRLKRKTPGIETESKEAVEGHKSCFAVK